MGITGLLPFLKKASSHCHVRRFSGCTVAIDAYCWLHKGAFGCADKLGKGEPTTAYVNYCLKYINVLLSHNIKPILVLDGRNLPSKATTEKKRREKRDENKKNAKEFLRKGMNKEAWECFTRCIDITPAMAREFIKALRNMNIDYIIAPYEADAQLAYMARKNIVDIVITEDSDLVLFGCPKIFFKMSVTGDGVLFDQSKLHLCMELKPEQFQFERFRWMCILSGCDYLASLPGIGLGRAKKLINGTNSRDIRKILKSISKVLRLDIEVPEEYIQGFLQAENTFLYQLVFDTISRKMIPLTPYAADVDHKELTYAGSYLSDKKLALDMALGNVDIHTLEKVDNFDPARPNSGYDQRSIWSPKYTISTIPRLVTARDLKKVTIHSSTIGMQANISVSSVIKKRSLSETELKMEMNETNDEELVSMYSTTDDSISSLIQKENDRKSSKRYRKSTDSEIDDISDDQNTNKSPVRKRMNPFLKFSNASALSNSPDKKATSNSKTAQKDEEDNSEVDPFCLIERNKIYDDDEHIIVKSQYFKHLDAEPNCSQVKDTPRKRTLRSRSTSKANFNISVQSDDDSDKCCFSLKIDEDSESNKLSQLTIYSIGTDEFEKLEKNESQKLSDNEEDSSEDTSHKSQSAYEGKLFKYNKSPGTDNSALSVITIEDTDNENPGEIKPRLKNSPIKNNWSGSSSVKPNANSRTVPLKMSGCRRQGLSKNGFKVDPKQKTLSAMFALQQKPKL